MGTDDLHPALRRILRDHGGDELLDTLADRLSGSDLTSLLLAVAARRAERVSPHDVLRQYERDRFVAAGRVDGLRLRRAEEAALRATTPRFDVVVLSPVAPLGTHAAVAGVAQDNVVTTMRGTEVAADPTSSLALEAALRRRQLLADEPGSPDVVRVATVDRVVRAQQFVGELSFSHFSLLGLVTAGRDRGQHRFEAQAFPEHISTLDAAARACGASRTRARLTDFDGSYGDVLDRTAERLGAVGVDCQPWPEREAARGYYAGLCFQLTALVGGEDVEVGDGGMVDWTQRLLGNQKERLMTSGLSVERLAILTDP